ncbi:MAG: NUDIX domain-containing protein [Actinobacteria bacterium]|nr:NUDIX domain-containing protein [Actinomycetota bacterium]
MSTPTVAVGAICIHEDRMLLIRRGREPSIGRWSLPGGRVETRELLADALVREVKEETGLDIEVGDLAGILEVPGEVHYVILDHFATVIGPSEPVAGDDAIEARWVPLDEVVGLDLTPRFLETLRGWGVLPEA